MKNMFLISVLIVVGTVGISAQDRVICYSDDDDRTVVNMASTRTEEFMDRCLEIPFGPVPRIMSLDSIISVLPHIKVRDGYTIQCVVPCGQRWLRSGLGLSSFIYARPVDRPQLDSTILSNYPIYIYHKSDYDISPDIYDPLEKIVIPEKVTKEFVWEAYLISRMAVDMPLYWHAEHRKEILLSTCPWFLDKLKGLDRGPYDMRWVDEQCLKEYKTSRANHLEAVLKNSDCEPRCMNYRDYKRITYWCWSNWHGLVARSIEFTLTDDSISFSRPSHDVTIVRYDCGVMF